MLHGHITYPRVRLWDTDVEVAASRYANASVKIWKRCWNWKRTPCLPIKSGRYERLNQPNPADDHRLFLVFSEEVDLLRLGAAPFSIVPLAPFTQDIAPTFVVCRHGARGNKKASRYTALGGTAGASPPPTSSVYALVVVASTKRCGDAVPL